MLQLRGLVRGAQSMELLQRTRVSVGAELPSTSCIA